MTACVTALAVRATPHPKGARAVADFEADVDTLTRTVVDLHERRPFDVLHAQFAYPTGLATLRAAHRVGRPAVVTVQGVDGRELGSCCDTHRQLVRAVFDHASALVIGSPSFAAEVDRLTDPVSAEWVRESLAWFPLHQPEQLVDEP